MTWLGGKPVPEDKPRRHIPMPAGEAATTVIRLERSGCYGTCAIYSVELHGNGDVVYEGKCFVVIGGRHSGRADPTKVATLLRQVRDADFWSLKRRYAAPVTDNATYRLFVTVGGSTKTVEDYVGQAAGMPKVVKTLEDAVDAVSGTDRWLTGNASTIPTLKAEGWDFHGTAAAHALARAAADAPEEVALELFALGAPAVSNPTPTDCYPDDRESAVKAAAEHRRLSLLQALISAGALAPAGSKEDALFGSIASGDPVVVKEILKHRPDVNARRPELGETPLLWIDEGPHPFSDGDPPRSDYPEIVRLLVAAGANPSLADHDGNTPLHSTLDADVARALINAGAPLDARNNYGETPLLSTYDEDVALALIDAGADVTLRNSGGSSAKDVATLNKWPKVLARLKASPDSNRIRRNAR